MPGNDRIDVLVVDDLPEKLLVFETILGDMGINVITARSGEEALRRVLELDFAVVLLDVNMPNMDGYETARFIRQRKKSAHTPIIFITAFADQAQMVEGYSVGAVDYIFSPVVPEILRTKVQVFVDLFRMTQQVKRQADEQIILARAQAARAAAEEATRRSSFLAEASTLLSSSLDVEATQSSLARLVVPFLADLSAVVLANDRGGLGRTELAWDDAPGKVRTLTAPEPAQSLPPVLSAAIAGVLHSGKPVTVKDCESWPVAPETDERAVRLPDDAAKTLLVLPLLARGHTLGALALTLRPAGHRQHPTDLALAQDMAGRAAIALDNARLYQNIQEADRRKNDFLVMLAHELRNPLAPIQNAVQILRLVGTTDQSLMEARDMIGRQVTHMARLIDDLLDMSRLARGKILLRRQTLDLVELVRTTTEDYRPILEGAGLRLDVRLPESPLYVDGDPTRLAQVAGNILHNASKFTDPGGRVSVDLSAGPDAVANITIRDTGIGMESAMLTRVFETFSQADNSLDRSRGGLGLGLTLVKGLIELHGGHVTATSAGLGRGTEIILTLPCARPAARPSATLAEASPAPAGRRIVIIEDHHDAAESMRRLFMLTGHSVTVAYSGPDGVAAARDFRPDVILCDIGLPGGMNGYEVAQAIRRDPDLAHIRLIALTGYGQEQDQRQSRAAGFDAHLTKPVDFPELQRLVASTPTRS